MATRVPNMASQVCCNSLKSYAGSMGIAWERNCKKIWGCQWGSARNERELASDVVRAEGKFHVFRHFNQGNCLVRAGAHASFRESKSGDVNQKLPVVQKAKLNDSVSSRSDEPEQVEGVELRQGSSFQLNSLVIDAGLLSGAGLLYGAVQLGTVSQDVGATVLALGGAYLWVRLFDELSRRDVLDQKLSRKLVHITAGLLFLFVWPFFSESASARFFASIPALTNMLRLLSLGLGLSKNEGVVKSVSREGNPSELLRGPLYYVMVLVFVTVVFWRESPVGITALGMMCGGDGIADIVGRRLGKAKLPYNKNKSWAGSIAMFFFGSLVSLSMVYIYCSLGYFSCNAMDTTWRIAVVALAATIVESLPITDKLDDNFTVPLTAIALGSLLFPGSLISLSAS